MIISINSLNILSRIYIFGLLEFMKLKFDATKFHRSNQSISLSEIGKIVRYYDKDYQIYRLYK